MAMSMMCVSLVWFGIYTALHPVTLFFLQACAQGSVFSFHTFLYPLIRYMHAYKHMNTLPILFPMSFVRVFFFSLSLCIPTSFPLLLRLCEFSSIFSNLLKKILPFRYHFTCNCVGLKHWHVGEAVS